MGNENIPLDLLIKILSSSKASKTYSFSDKINLLVDWVGNNDERKKTVGLFRLENGDYYVDTKILSNIMSIQPKSIIKNFSIAGYKKKAVIEYGKSFLLTKDDNNQHTLVLGQQNESLPEGVPNELWSNQINENWESFSKSFPELLVSDLDSFLPNPIGGFLKTSQLIRFIYNTDTITPLIFGSILKHFGPLSIVNLKVGTLCMSLISRGWTFDTEASKHVSLENPNKFIFTDSKKSCTLLNNDSFNKMDLYWLRNEETGEMIDLEDFWNQEFPAELQSKEFIADILMEYFPEE